MDVSQPIGNIKPQKQNNGSPILLQNILVDDPVALVDDPIALTGSQVTTIPVMRITVSSSAPTGAVKQPR